MSIYSNKRKGIIYKKDLKKKCYLMFIETHCLSVWQSVSFKACFLHFFVALFRAKKMRSFSWFWYSRHLAKIEFLVWRNFLSEMPKSSNSSSYALVRFSAWDFQARILKSDDMSEKFKKISLALENRSDQMC